MHHAYDVREKTKSKKIHFQNEIVNFIITSEWGKIIFKLCEYLHIGVCLYHSPSVFYFLSFFVSTIFLVIKYLLLFSLSLDPQEKASNWTAHSGFYYYLTLRARHNPQFFHFIYWASEWANEKNSFCYIAVSSGVGNIFSHAFSN